MNIDHYIKELLYQHDCVIIPDFGGFLANYRSAEIKPDETGQHLFIPPSKDIVFNRSLRNNDGILINYISKKQNIGYREACDSVISYSRTLSERLQRNEHIYLGDIGTLYNDSAFNTQFTADKKVNYLTMAYGLGAFQMKAVETGQAPQLELKPAHQTIRSVHLSRNLKRAFVAASVAVALIIVPLQFDITWASLLSQNTSDTTNTAKASIIDTKIFTSDSNRTSEKRADYTTETTKNQITETSEKYYYIIAGSFGNVGNAQKLMNGLRNKGFDAVILDEEGGKCRVAYSKHTHKQEAVVELNRIKTTAHDQSVWIYCK